MSARTIPSNIEDLVKQLQERIPYQNNEYLRSPRYFQSCLQDYDYDLAKTEEAILKTYKWREEIGIDEILNENFDDIFVPFDYEFNGVDRGGRPILSISAKEMGKKANAIMHQAVKDGLKDKDKTVRWGFFMGETILKAISDANLKSPNHTVDSIVVIIDMKGIQVMDFLQYVPLVLPTALPLLNTCREHFSGVLYRMYIINGSKAPAKLGIQFLKGQHTNIEERVKILGKKKHKWQKILLENIAPEQLSTRFGGLLESEVIQPHVSKKKK